MFCPTKSPIDFNGAGSAPAPLLLDTYTGASAAYSLRKLRTDYAGSAIRVRRSIDNSEQDFAFVANALDAASLLAFCAGGDGFVATWYDQAGGFNATQTTAANQPRIVSSGVVDTENGNPTLVFSGNQSLTTSLSIITAPAAAIYAVFKLTNTVLLEQVLADSVPSLQFVTSGNALFAYLNDYPNYSSYASSNTNLRVVGCYCEGSGVGNANRMKVWEDGVSIALGFVGAVSATFTLTPPITIGSWGVTRYMNGCVSEVIFFGNSQIANQAGLDADINSYWI